MLRERHFAFCLNCSCWPVGNAALALKPKHSEVLSEMLTSCQMFECQVLQMSSSLWSLDRMHACVGWIWFEFTEGYQWSRAGQTANSAKAGTGRAGSLSQREPHPAGGQIAPRPDCDAVVMIAPVLWFIGKPLHAGTQQSCKVQGWRTSSVTMNQKQEELSMNNTKWRKQWGPNLTPGTQPDTRAQNNSLSPFLFCVQKSNMT